MNKSQINAMEKFMDDNNLYDTKYVNLVTSKMQIDPDATYGKNKFYVLVYIQDWEQGICRLVRRVSWNTEKSLDTHLETVLAAMDHDMKSCFGVISFSGGMFYDFIGRMTLNKWEIDYLTADSGLIEYQEGCWDFTGTTFKSNHGFHFRIFRKEIVDLLLDMGVKRKDR